MRYGGGRWSPNGQGVVTKSGNVKNYLTPGERTVFVVRSTNSPTSSNRMRFGIMKFDLVIEGFLRGSNMSELYKAIAGSPITYLAGDISAGQTTIAVADDTSPTGCA